MSIQVGIYNIGGEVPLIADVGTFTDLSWSHLLDGFGEASVTIPNCTERLLNVHPFTHELRITDDKEVAFVGPIRYAPLPMQAGGTLQIVAFDVAYWLAVRFVHFMFDYTGTSTPVSDIVSDIAINALGVEDPNLLQFLNVQPCATIHERKSRDVYDSAWKLHLQTIVGKLMHMSVKGRAINFWCVNECLSSIPDASIEQFRDFSKLVRDGDTFTTRAAVYGDETLGVVGVSGGVHADWPVLVERLIEERSYLDSVSATAAAVAQVTSSAQFGSADNDDFSAVVDCQQPWRFTRLAPGMCTNVRSPYGNLRLRISKLSGEVSEGIVTRKIGFKEI